MRDRVDEFALESLFCARVDLFLCEYLGTPLCDNVCGLVVYVSVVLYFYDVVIMGCILCRSGSYRCPLCVWLLVPCAFLFPG